MQSLLKSVKSVVVQLVVKPGSRVGPDIMGLSSRDAQDFRRLLHGESREVPQLHKLGGLLVRFGEAGEGFVQVQQILGVFRCSQVGLIQVLPHAFAAAFLAVSAPRAFHVIGSVR